jgi:DNA-binding transcriptional LysR family regulator
MIACEKLMVEGRVQFLLCHHHPAAATRLTQDTFCSIAIGQDVLLPVAAPALALTSPLDGPYLAYTSESGMGRILAASWSASGKAAPRAPAFSSHLASVLAAMARDGRGVAWAPRSLVEEDLAAGRLLRVGIASDEVSMEIRLFRPQARQSKTAEALWERAVALQDQAEKSDRKSTPVSSGRSS